MLDAKTIETSILRVNNDSFTGPLIIGTFEKRAPGAPFSKVPITFRTLNQIFKSK